MYSPQAALNFNSLANKEDGSCVARRPGCVLRYARNFNASANDDDGSCDVDLCVARPALLRSWANFQAPS